MQVVVVVVFVVVDVVVFVDVAVVVFRYLKADITWSAIHAR